MSMFMLRMERRLLSRSKSRRVYRNMMARITFTSVHDLMDCKDGYGVVECCQGSTLYIVVPERGFVRFRCCTFRQSGVKLASSLWHSIQGVPYVSKPKE